MNSRVNKLGGALLSAVLLLAGICPSPAETTTNVYWDFSGPAGPDKPTLGTISGLTTAFSFGNAASLNYNASSSSSSYTTAAGFTASAGTNAYVAVRTGAFDIGTNTYFSFSLSLSLITGTSYTISDVSLGSRSTGSGPTSLALYSSTDGSSFSAVGSPLAVNQDNNWAAADFSGILIALPNDGSTVYFRLYGTGSSSASSGNWRIDDLAVTMVSVPEPSTVALAMLGGVACLFSFRRKG